MTLSPLTGRHAIYVPTGDLVTVIAAVPAYGRAVVAFPRDTDDYRVRLDQLIVDPSPDTPENRAPRSPTTR